MDPGQLPGSSKAHPGFQAVRLAPVFIHTRPILRSGMFTSSKDKTEEKFSQVKALTCLNLYDLSAVLQQMSLIFSLSGREDLNSLNLNQRFNYS